MGDPKLFFDNPFDLTYKVDITEWKILVADKDLDFYARVDSCIKGFKFEDKPIQVLSASSYQEAVSKIVSTPDLSLSIINLSIDTPNDGLEVVSYIRDSLEDENIKITIVADDYEEEYNTLLNYNVNDFRVKDDLTEKKLFSSIITGLRSYHDTLETIQLKNELEELVDSRTIELIEANTRIEKNLQEIEEDQKSGKTIQAKMLPINNRKIHDFRFEYFWHPALYLSGDILDYFDIDDNHIGFYLADVSGHGISSAFITIFVKSLVHQYINLYNNTGDWTVLDPPKILSIINIELLHEDLEKHLTMFYGIINVKEHKLIYSTGGHYPFPALFYDNKSELIKDKGFSVGNFDIAKYTRYERVLPDKFNLLVMTDGVIDIMPLNENSDKEKFILDLYKEDEHIGIKTILERIGYNSKTKLPDDLTILKICNY